MSVPAPGSPPQPPREERVGLCADCAHQRLVPNTRGSTFSLCERSRVDRAYPRYPRLPVLECRGWEPPKQDAGL